MNTVFIYALNDPDTGLTRYVGKAIDPVRRFRVHMSAWRTPRCHRTNWIQSLRDAGKKPVMEILDEVPETEWPQWEVAWIEFYREQGFDLVNQSEGGTGGSSLKGVAHPMFGRRGELSPNFGKKLSHEHCANIRAGKVGKATRPVEYKHSEETLTKMRKPRMGKVWKTGKDHPHFGLKRSDESRFRMSVAGKIRCAFSKIYRLELL